VFIRNFGIAFATCDDKDFCMTNKKLKNIVAGDEQPVGMSIGQISIDLTRFTADPNTDDLLILPTRNLVLFPNVHLSLGLGREMSIKVAEYAERTSMPIGIVCQIDPEVNNPSINDIYKYGVIADVLKVIDLPDGSKTALVRSRDKFRILGRGEGVVLPGALSAKIKLVHETVPRRTDKEFEAMVDNVRNLAQTIIRKTFDGRNENPFNIDSSNPVDLINNVATNMPLRQEEKYSLLALPRIKDRAFTLLGMLQQNDEMIDISREIMERARHGMEQNQRNAFLQQQMETIREELYGDDADDADEFERRAEEANLPEKVAKVFNKELEKLRRLNPQSPDYSVQYTYLDTFLSLPWSVEDELCTDFVAAEETLNRDHYGLEKVKERIIEQVAVLMDNPGGKAPILCLVGPPGVGKTSLGASIAAALGRKYQRVALGGLHDEAEIRGHRRTYIGSMPGRIIDAMKRAQTRNPVLLLDELDKIGADFKGDPAAALLEVLDPEQNCHFHDNYIDVDFDLSHVLFIATANTLQTVSRPLLDRIEVIDIPGYLLEEKVEIAKRHLLPRILKEQGWKENSLSITDEAFAAIIERYTAESGVRQLEKSINAIVRKAVLAKMRQKDFVQPVLPEHLQELLGTPPFHRDKCEPNPVPGVVTGLAWTQVGGEILLVEVSLAPVKAGGKLTLTGNLGDVMKESASIALQWVKANANDLGIDNEMFEKHNIHVHFPEGAIPKDGPSAGITMATAIVSALTGRPVKSNLAMTGEITLRGRVLPVGGIREKILAARRAGVTDVILSNDNRRDIADIPAKYLEGLTMHHVDTVAEVIEQALTK
jgi:ATP-dependent Lon protease